MENKKIVSKSLFSIVVVALAILLVASVCFCVWTYHAQHFFHVSAVQPHQ